MEESFGIVKVLCNHQYCKILRRYVHSDFDMIGIYYPSQTGSSFLLYDGYTGREISNTSISEILSWDHVSDINTSKFYFCDDDLRESFAATIMNHSERTIEKCIRNGARKMQPFEQFTSRLSCESSFTRTSVGQKCVYLELIYESLHKDLFSCLENLSIEGFDLFSVPKRPQRKHKNSPIFVSALSARNEEINLYKTDIDLGKKDFSHFLKVNYHARPSKNLEINTGNTKISLTSSSADFTHIKSDVLKKLLVYVVGLEDKRYCDVETEILKELSKRKNKK